MLRVKSKGNEMYDDLQANSLPLHTPITPGTGSKLFFESGHVAYIKLKGIKCTTCKQIYCPYTHTRPLRME